MVRGRVAPLGWAGYLLEVVKKILKFSVNLFQKPNRASTKEKSRKSPKISIKRGPEIVPEVAGKPKANAVAAPQL
jgi:hypothetical protein